MTAIQFFREWIGVPSGYDGIFIAIAGAAALLIMDNILRCLFGIISSLFKNGRTGDCGNDITKPTSYFGKHGTEICKVSSFHGKTPFKDSL